MALIVSTIGVVVQWRLVSAMVVFPDKCAPLRTPIRDLSRNIEW